MILKNTLLLALISLLTFSCKKDSPSISKTALLTQKEWVVTAERSQMNNNPWEDEFSDSPNCVNDNRIVFSTNGTYDILQGPTKCNTSDPDIIEENETWAFTENEARISMSHNGGWDFKILQLDQNTFKILHEYQQNGNTYREETTLSHP